MALVRGKVGAVSYGNNPKLPALVGEVVWDYTKLQIFRAYRTSTSVEFYEADWHYNTVPEL